MSGALVLAPAPSERPWSDAVSDRARCTSTMPLTADVKIVEPESAILRKLLTTPAKLSRFPKFRNSVCEYMGYIHQNLMYRDPSLECGLV